MPARRLPHYCHAEGCEVRVPPAMFMCKPHWFSLPKAMRDEIWDVYEPGQEQRMDPTDEYIEVARRCVEWVAKREGRHTNV